jgi:hypothetical protein
MLKKYNIMISNVEISRRSPTDDFIVINTTGDTITVYTETFYNYLLRNGNIGEDFIKLKLVEEFSKIVLSDSLLLPIDTEYSNLSSLLHTLDFVRDEITPYSKIVDYNKLITLLYHDIDDSCSTFGSSKDYYLAMVSKNRDVAYNDYVKLLLNTIYRYADDSKKCFDEFTFENDYSMGINMLYDYIRGNIHIGKDVYIVFKTINDGVISIPVFKGNINYICEDNYILYCYEINNIVKTNKHSMRSKTKYDDSTAYVIFDMK